MEPLAQRLRPRTLDEVCGQQHLLGKNQVFRRTVESGHIPNMIFYGPSGVGKTTVASIIAAGSGMKLHKLNGTTASTSDIKSVLNDIGTLGTDGGILLYLDEIQYFNKRQQQSLLECVEQGTVTLIASTTENPYFYVYNAILSRSTVFEFKPVTPAQALPAVQRAVRYMAEKNGVTVQAEDGVFDHICYACGGDMRKALNITELCVLGSPAPKSGEKRAVTVETAKEVCARSPMHFDRDGDEYYDMLSCFQKSMRGSDADAAVYYLARILEAGDLVSACRRLAVCAAEDVGLAYPMILPIVKAACDIAMQVGLPEARIPLADAVILVATSPKSNSAYNAVNDAERDIKAGLAGPVPRHLQNKHFDGADNAAPGQFYEYPHDFPEHWVRQQYLPDVVKDKIYYTPGENKTEQAAKQYWDKIKRR